MFLEDALELKSELHSDTCHVLICQNLPDREIRTIRKTYKLHPVLDAECSSNENNNRDNCLIFEDYFFLSINELYSSQDNDYPIAMKSILYDNLLIIFCNEPLLCIEELLLNKIYFHEKMNQIDHEKRTSRCRPIIENIFKLLIENIFKRIEVADFKIEEEAKVCLRFATDLSAEERADFLLRISMAKKKLIYYQNIVKPKLHLFDQLLESSHVSQDTKYMLKSMKLKVTRFLKNIKKSWNLFSNAATIYNGTTDNELTKSSIKLDAIMSYFTALSVLFIPLNFSVTCWGMNLKVPFGDVSNTTPFIAIMVVSLIFLVTSMIIIKLKSWLN